MRCRVIVTLPVTLCDRGATEIRVGDARKIDSIWRSSGLDR
jgi:hypothetical protein